MESAIISTHAPLAGRDNKSGWQFPKALISTHAPLAGRDAAVVLLLIHGITFQPTRPLRGATNVNSGIRAIIKFQPTRPLRGATFTRSPL